MIDFASSKVKMVAAIVTLFVLLMAFKMEARAAVMQTAPATSVDGINEEITEIPEVVNGVPLAAHPETHEDEIIEIIPETVSGRIPDYITVNLDNANGFRYGVSSMGLLFVTDSCGKLLAVEDSENSGIVVYIVKNGVRTSAVHDDGTLVRVRIVA